MYTDEKGELFPARLLDWTRGFFAALSMTGDDDQGITKNLPVRSPWMPGC